MLAYIPAPWIRHGYMDTIVNHDDYSDLRLVHITPITMVYGRYNYSIHGVYKPTNITGGHHPVGIGLHDIGAPIGDEESWSLVLRGSRRTLELLRQLPEAFRDDVLVPHRGAPVKSRKKKRLMDGWK